jgi:hypothetical protein
MEIASNEIPFTAPPALGFVNVVFTSTIQKPVSTDVITSGGFKLSAANSIYDINVLGSYPTIESKVGTIDNVAGWTNNISILAGRTCTITNYILYSIGNAQIPKNIPLFDQGAAIKQNSLASTITDPSSMQLEVDKNYFCTGGGYNLNVAKNATIYYPMNVWQNNATTKSGVFFGWQFSGHDFGAFTGKPNFDMYALPIKFH